MLLRRKRFQSRPVPRRHRRTSYPGVVSSVLAWVGLSPSVSNNPLAPVHSPALWAVLAWARRQNQQTLTDETPTISTTPAQSSQTVDSVVTDNTAHCRRR